MPELPEVETTRRALSNAIVGTTVRSVTVSHPRMVRRQQRSRDFSDRLTGRKVESVGRHGKFLMSRINGDLTWVTHLGMSGRIRLAPPGTPREPHSNVVVTTDRDLEVRFVDPRTFGFMAVYTPGEMAESSLAKLGPDALDDLPRSNELASRLSGRTAPIKALLLDQGIVAGLGNIYADEVLHRAGLDPRREGGSLHADDVKKLRNAIKPVLQAGLRYGGTSLDDLAYLLPNGQTGRYLSRLRVYGREGEPCRECGTPVERAVLRGRSAHWCPTCQT